jgi:uncharacterized protein (TIGR03118 family)
MRTFLIALSAGLLTLTSSLPAANNYLQHNLVSNNSGTADHSDQSLVNPGGIAFSATGPFWIANQGSGVASIYNSAGIANPAPVSVPPQSTAIVQNSTTDFPVAPGVPASFIFCSAAGTISVWNANSPGSSAVVKIDRSQSSAIYTGLARASNAAGSALYAVNFHAGTVEVYDGNFNLLTTSGSFQDPAIPAGFVPYNIWATGNKLYVTFAQQNAGKSGPVAAAGMGYVDLFDVNGSLVQHVTGGGPLNAPWGLALAPAKFGDFAGALLVGNSGDGTINAFDVSTGRALGTLANTSGQTLSIPGLRALVVGNGAGAGDSNAVYFTAGSSNQGLFGSLQAAPVISNNGVINAAGYQLGAAPYTFVSIIGNNLAATTRSWQTSDFVNGQLPRSLDGVGVTVNGAPAYISYISPTQLNVLMPAATAPGTMQTTNNGLTGASVAVQYYQLTPAFFQVGASGFATATHADGTLIGPLGQFTASTRPARVGEIIVLYGNGFGATSPPQPEGSLVTAPLPLVTPPAILIGGAPAQVIYAGLTGTGLYQFNIVVPQVDPGNVDLTAQIGSVTTPPTMLAIQ